MKNKMAAINKYRYLQAIFVGIPMGLASLYYGSIALFDIQQNVNDYQNFYGVVDSVYVDYFKTSEQSKHISEVLCVKVNNNVYYLTYGKHRDIIESHIFIGDTINVWYSQKKTGKIIKAIRKNGNDIIKYKPGGYWVGVLFILWGLFWLIISILYIFKHPEDLKGEEKTE